MPFRTAIWKVGAQPEQLVESSLATEQELERMIVSNPRLVSDEWMLIGQQEDTGFGGRIDLLAIAPDGALVLIELKRGQTPREVVAQALDYASWVENLGADDIASIYARFAPGQDLASDFRDRNREDLTDEMLNSSHQIIIIAASLDDSTERIVNYLTTRGIPINVLCFQIFSQGAEQLLSRTWLLDPVRTQASVTSSANKSNDPWNGELYCSFGEGESRSWSDASKYGFICAGGGAWYSRTLQQISPGDLIWVRVPAVGFVGVGRATGRAQPAAKFKVTTPTGEAPVLDVAKGGTYHKEFVNDPERTEYFVPVKWIETVPLEKAVREVGLFGNQNSVCKPTAPKWRHTVARLRERFPKFIN